MTCNNCQEALTDNNAFYAFGEPYCEDCFSDYFNYCVRCDTVISRENSHYNDDGDSYCSDCWEDGYDDDAPDNPEVYEEDRDLIVNLSRGWLKTDYDTRRMISINSRDHHLKAIRNKVGLTHNRIYVFGLIDRDEYQLSASQDIIEEVREFAMLNLPDVTVVEALGAGRLGVSLSLRTLYSDEIISLIRMLTTEEKPVLAE